MMMKTTVRSVPDGSDNYVFGLRLDTVYPAKVRKVYVHIVLLSQLDMKILKTEALQRLFAMFPGEYLISFVLNSV